MNVEQAADAIVDDAGLRAGTRGTLVLVEVPQDLALALKERVEVELGEITWLLFDGSPPCVQELQALNRGRDVLLPATPALVVACPTPALLRQARSQATDLLATPDLTLHVQSQDAQDWSTCSARLRDVMVERHRYLDLTGLLPGDVDVRRVPLEELYIDLLREPAESDTPNAGALHARRLFRELHAIYGDDVQLGLGEGDAGEEPEGPRPIVVLAQPGAGKTTLLRHEVNAIAQGTSQLFQDGRVPVLVPLAGYAAARRERVHSLLDYCEAFAGQAVGMDRLPLREHPSAVVLLLDGLDEIPDRTVRRRVLDEIIAWPGKHGLERVLLTSRSYLSPELERVRSRLDVRSLRAATDQDIEDFLRAFARLRGRGRDPADLIERIGNDRALAELARNPLLLVFLAVLDDVDRDLPSQRTVLYRDLTELLISRWQPRRNPGAPNHRRLKRGDAIRVLGPLGWWMVSRGGQPATEPELLQELTRIEQRREPDPALAARQAADRLAQLKEETALLFHDGRYAFAHLSFAEYFAGVEAARDPARRQVLQADPYSPDWREVVRFTLVLLTDIECRDAEARQLAQAIIDRSRRPGRYDSKIPKLLSDLAMEGPSLPSDLRQAMVERNVTISMTNALVEDEAREAREALMEAALDSRSAWSKSVQHAMVERFDGGAPVPIDNDPLFLRLPELVAVSEVVEAWVRRALGECSHSWLYWCTFWQWYTETSALVLVASGVPFGWLKQDGVAREDARVAASRRLMFEAARGLWTRRDTEPSVPATRFRTVSKHLSADPFWRAVSAATGVLPPVAAARAISEQAGSELRALLAPTPPPPS